MTTWRILVVGGLMPSLLFDMVNSGATKLMTHIEGALKIGGAL